MKRILLILLLLVILIPSALATGTNQVRFNLQTFAGNPTDRTLIIKPIGAPWFVNSNIVYAENLTNTTSSGTATTNLYAGPYSVSFSGLAGTVIIDVTNSATLQDAASIARKTPAAAPAIRYYTAAEVDALISAVSTNSGTGTPIRDDGSTTLVTTNGGTNVVSVLVSPALTAPFNISDVPVTASGGILSLTNFSIGIEARSFIGNGGSTTNLSTNNSPALALSIQSAATYTNTADTVGVLNGKGIGSNLTSLATAAALTTVSNQVLTIAATNRNSLATYTNLQPVYSTDTNTISVVQKGLTNVVYFEGPTMVWNTNGYYTNNLTSASRRSGSYSSGWRWATNVAQSAFFTNVSDGLFGIARNDAMPGIWLEITPLKTSTNIIGYATNLIRGTELSLSDFGYRPDGRLIYGMTVSNGVAIVPGGQFTASDLGKWFLAYTDAGATNFYTALITAVNNATNITLADNIKNLVATNVGGVYGSGNYLAWSNALNTTSGTVILTVPPGLGLIEQAVYDPQTGNNVALKIPATQSFNTTNTQSRTIVIRGPSPTIIYPQFIVGGSTNSVRMPIDGTVVMNIAKPLVGANSDRNVFVQHSWSNRVTSVPPQFAPERVFIDSITFRQPLNNKFDGIWWDTGGTVYLNNLQIDKDVPPGFINVNTGDPAWWERGFYDDSTNANVGLWLPRTYNYAGAHLMNVTVSYYGLGAQFTEHTIGDGKISMVGCDTGAHFSGMVTNLGTQTGPRFNMFYVYRSRYPITVNTNCLRETASFGALHFETQGARVNYHITDPAQKFKFSAGMITGPETPSVQSSNGVWYDAISGVWHGNGVNIAEGGVMTGASIDASQLTSGTIPMGRLATGSTSSTAGLVLGAYFTDGTNRWTSRDGQILTNVTTLATVTSFGGSGGVSVLASGGSLTVSNANNSAPADLFAGSFRTTTGGIFVGDGANITNLNATNIAFGTVRSAQLGSTNSVITTNDQYVLVTLNGTQQFVRVMTNLTLVGATVSVGLNVSGGGVTNANGLYSGTAFKYVQFGTDQVALSAGSSSGYLNVNRTSPAQFGLQPLEVLAGYFRASSNFVSFYTQPTTNGLNTQGFSWGSNGTNMWCIDRDSGGILTTSKVTRTTWP